ncbi:CrcB protein [Trueperella bonasi]|uniref:Fluoride-specific ion channel FluC n=1 Tax=Trueperella bonasi TaxID=312286 RepID=A0ABT9NI49_9ACTO|nr:CrcB family protein [Trueperella bonasi]MDP9807080.1 CrcB protein [Trueperella bonasi]
MNGLLVALGGALGASVRFVLVAGSNNPPAVTFLINIAGAFLLGIIAATTAGRVRLFVGTGVLGGFTTYSAFAVDALSLMSDSILTGLAYAVLTVVVGIVAAAFGLHLVRTIGGER